MKPATVLIANLLLFVAAACGGADEGAQQATTTRDPAPGETPAVPAEEDDHEHAETPLGTVRLGELEVELAQGHGAVVAGKESHLVVKLPYSDSGGTVVRAWIGTEDRTRSYVGKGQYTASHGDYDVHATAPDPLPAGALWWIELEQPDGTKLVGSARPLLE
jgi:hypothetical protein